MLVLKCFNYILLVFSGKLWPSFAVAGWGGRRRKRNKTMIQLQMLDIKKATQNDDTEMQNSSIPTIEYIIL
jgi:hypothetical protein